MIYLDNSATTWPKPQAVVKAALDAITTYGANPGRSGHSFSLKTAMKIYETREKLAKFVGAESAENIIFTSGCTEALNLAILGTIQKDGHVVCSVNDHNSTLRPLSYLADEKIIDLSIAEPKTHRLTLNDIKPLVRPNTYLICVSHVSNVDGMEADIDEIGKFCFENCILLLVDSAQSAGHKKINMLSSHIDMLAIAGHKGLLGIMGAGALAVSSRVKLQPLKFGGTGTDSEKLTQPLHLPEGFESGTLPVPAILALGAGLEFVEQNFNQTARKIDDLTTYLNYELSQIKGVKVYTHPDNANGVLAFNIGDMPSNEVAEILDKKFKIMVRSGLHCAPLKHKHLGTLQQGAVRASLGAFSKFSDVERLIKAVKRLAISN